MANEFECRYGSKGLHEGSLTPGGIFTGLLRHKSEDSIAGHEKNEALLKVMLSVEQCAALTVWAAVGREWEGKGGFYLENLQEVPSHPDPADRDTCHLFRVCTACF
jgi:hypothetical protein